MWKNFFEEEKVYLNPYVEKMNDFPEYIYYVPEKLKALKGCWQHTFGDDKPLYVEIGSGNGNHVVRQAEFQKDINYIACELRFKRLVVSAKKSKKRDLTNVKFLREYAQNLTQVFDTNEIDRIFIYFPEPWEREKRQNNRVLSEAMLDIYKTFLKPGGEIWFKTDHDSYFDDVKRVVDAREDFEIKELSYDFKTPFLDQTEFEQMFLKQDIKIKQMILVKRG